MTEEGPQVSQIESLGDSILVCHCSGVTGLAVKGPQILVAGDIET